MTQAQDMPSALPENSVVALQGMSRELYGFTVFPLDAAPAVAGIYMLVRPADAGHRDTLYWVPLFVGEAGDVRDAVRGAGDMLGRARKLGATHLLVHFCGRGTEARTEKSHDLIGAFRPALNGYDGAAEAA